MANYNKHDARLESLVVEVRTLWSLETGDVSETHKTRLAAELHRRPEAAENIHYERVHTGFAREITVTPEDIERLNNA